MQRSTEGRGRRWLVITASGLVVLVALAVVANVVLTRYVKDGVVQALRCATGDDTITPAVSLGRTPMLIELASREVDEVTISGLSPSSMRTMDGAAPSAGSPAAAVVDEGDMSITLHGVGLSDPPTLKSADASVLLGFDGLGSAFASGESAQELAGATLAEEDGLLAVTLPEEIGGQPVRVLVSLKPDGESMTVTPESVVIGGRRLGVGLVSLFAGDVLLDENGESRLKPRTIDLDLPEGAALESIKVQPTGLAMGLSIDPSLVREKGGAAGKDCLAG